MLDSLSLPLLITLFTLAAAVVWLAGVWLSDAIDALMQRFGFGEALGGAIGLAIVTNLPEIAIVGTAALRGDTQLATGNILGGIAMQTVVLAVLDVVGLGSEAPLTRRAAAPVLVLEGLLVIAVLALTLMGHYLPPTLIVAGVTPAVTLITLAWLGGLHLINLQRLTEPANPIQGPPPTGRMARHAVRFLVAAAATLVAGVALELSSERIAVTFNIRGALFGATILAAATSLPEISTGLEAMRLRDYRMAVSDIFGGNAFLPVLFLLATLMSGRAVLPMAQGSDLYLTGLSILLTAVYIGGLTLRAPRQLLWMGVDSFLVVLLYLLGIAGLAWVVAE
jgi:cation:H+ antiporter